jgi:hypothetical protein
MELFDTLSYVTGDSGKSAHMRNLIGSVAAEVASRILNAQLLPIDGRKTICPDFRFQKHDGEIKSCVRRRRALVYKHRLEKEQAHYDPAEYLYVFVSHSASSNEKRREKVIESFKKGVDLHCCTLGEVATLLRGRKLRTVKLPPGEVDSRVGYYREGYRDGFYEFNVSEFSWPHLINYTTFEIAGVQAPCKLHESKGWKHLFA